MATHARARAAAPQIESAGAERTWFDTQRLRIGAIEDPLERAADDLAAQALNVPRDHSRSGENRRLAAPAIVYEVLRSPGAPLPTPTRSAFESRFGHNFANVRVHHDELAARSAAAVDARAYTAWNHVVFGRGAYDPFSQTGQRFIGHELAHTLQPFGTSEPELRRQPATGGGAGSAPLPPPRRVVMLDSDVLSQIAGGNKPAAESLQAMRSNGADVRIARPTYNEALRGRADQVSARKLMVQELHIAIDEGKGLASRMPTYDVYAGKGVKVQEKDLPMIAAAQTSEAEIWSFDGGVKSNVKQLGVKLAPESSVSSLKTPLDTRAGLDNVGLHEWSVDASGAAVRRPPPSGGAPPAAGAPPGGGAGPESAAGAKAPEAAGAAAELSPKAAVAEVPGAAEMPKVTELSDVKPPTGALEAEAAAAGGVIPTSIAGVAFKFVLKQLLFLALSLFASWASAKLFASAFENDVKERVTPWVMARLKRLEPRIVELQGRGKVFAFVTFEMEYNRNRHDLDPVTEFMQPAPPFYHGVTPLGVHVGNDEVDVAAFTTETIKEVVDAREIVVTRFGYRVLLDDPQKRARDAEQAELAQRLNRLGQQRQAAQPTPPKPGQPSQLLPAPGPAAPAGFEPLPGAPGPSPIQQAMLGIARAQAQTRELLARAEALDARTTSDTPPTPEERASFKLDEEHWRTSVTYLWNYFKDNPPDAARATFDELLHSDKYGGRLEQIRIHLVG